MDKKLIQSIILLIITVIFLLISNYIFNDNYSIQQLIEIFQLYRGDSLDYTIKVNQGDDYKQCTFRGGYHRGKLTIDSIKDKHKIDTSNKANPKSEKHKLNCGTILDAIGLKFIGDFDISGMQNDYGDSVYVKVDDTIYPNSNCDKRYAAPDDKQVIGTCPKEINMDI